MNAFDKVIGYKATKRELLQLCDMLQTYFNPRPPRGGRRRRDDPPHQHDVISIHAPREGGDGRPDSSTG